MAQFPIMPVFDGDKAWGPPRNDDSLGFDIPYQSFVKGDKLARIAEWIPDPSKRGRGRGGRYGAAWEYMDEDEKNWTTADYTKSAPKRGFRPRNRVMGRGQAGRGGLHARRGGRGGVGGLKPKKKADHRDPGFRRKDIHRSASTEVKQSWNLLSSINIPDLTKVSAERPHPIPKTETLATNGALFAYNETFDGATPKTPYDICQMGSCVDNSALTDSEDIRKIAMQQAANADDNGIKMYATDMVLATLMSSTKSVNSWDVIVERTANTYFLSNRSEGSVGKWTVDESAHEPPPIEEPQNATLEQQCNTMGKLMNELTLLNLNFSQQVLNKRLPVKKGKFAPERIAPKPENQPEGKAQANVVYRYNQWVLPGDITLVARTHFDGVCGKKQRPFRGFALLDHSGAAWKQKLPDSQGAVLGSEVQSNCCRILKQIACCLLSGSEVMKLGFISRKKSTSTNSHSLVHMKAEDPKKFLTSFNNINVTSLWNVLIKILDEVVKTKSAEKTQSYVLMKDPNKNILKV